MKDHSLIHTPNNAANSSLRPPDIGSDWALFLDLDGTLLDIAPTPTSVVVPDGLIDSLQGLFARLDGALAIVTGRPVDDVDRLLAPLHLPIAGNHGASARLPDGTTQPLAPVAALPADWVERARTACADWPGTIVEVKPYSLALHYRLAPDRDRDVFELLHRFAAERPDEYEILRAHQAFELRPRLATKGLAIERLMTLPPFRGRMPVFIGDDVTDESGRDAARRLGGLGLEVATDFDGRPAAVRQWLASAAECGRA